MDGMKAVHALCRAGVLVGCVLLMASCSSPPLTGEAGLPDGQSAGIPSISPTARILVEPVGPLPAGLAIRFSADGSDPGIAEQDAFEIRYLWTFGDGTMASGNTVTHRYASEGAYTVTLSLEVIDASMAFFRDSAVAYVAVTGPSAALTVHIASPADGEEWRTLEPILFTSDGWTAQGSPLDDLTQLSISWDFGDGSASSHAQQTSHLYETPGTHTATVRISGTDPMTGQALEGHARRDVVVLNRPPDPEIVVVPADGASRIVAGQPVILNASDSRDPEGQPLFVAWDIDGDGILDLPLSNALTHRMEKGFPTVGARDVTAHVYDAFMIAAGAQPMTQTIRVQVARPGTIGIGDGVVFGGGMLQLSELVLWGGQIGGAFFDGNMVASVGYGASREPLTISMTEWLPIVAAEGYEVDAYVAAASLVSVAGLGRLFEQVYVGGSLGMLTCTGEYRASTRVTLDGSQGPVSFKIQRPLLGLSIGYRVARFGMITFGVMLPL